MSFNFDDAMESAVDALPDMPQRGNLPNGRFILTIAKIERKPLGDKDTLIFGYKLLEVLELANPEAPCPPVGEAVEEIFSLESEVGVGKLKQHLKPVAAGRKLGQLLEELVGQNVQITAKVRQWKDKASGETRTGWQTYSSEKDGGLQPLGG